MIPGCWWDNFQNMFLWNFCDQFVLPYQPEVSISYIIRDVLPTLVLWPTMENDCGNDSWLVLLRKNHQRERSTDTPAAPQSISVWHSRENFSADCCWFMGRQWITLCRLSFLLYFFFYLLFLRGLSPHSPAFSYSANIHVRLMADFKVALGTQCTVKKTKNTWSAQWNLLHYINASIFPFTFSQIVKSCRHGYMGKDTGLIVMICRSKTNPLQKNAF